MNQRDKDNLAFLMSLAPSAFDKWMEVADSDDIDYALELLAVARLECIAAASDQVENTNTAKDYLKKFMLSPNTPTV